MAVLGLGLVFVSRPSFRGRSIALLCILALMFYQSLEFIVSGLHAELMRPDPVAVGIRRLFSFFFDVNLSLAIAGVLAAFGVAVFMEFGKSRLPLANSFPEDSLLEPPAQVIQSVNRLSDLAGISPPQVSLIDSGKPCALITRSKQGFVMAVSVGLLESLDAEELEACLAHELSHLKNRDFIVRFLATMGKVGLFSRPWGYFIEPAVYRERELLADKTAVELVGGPNALISALSKIRESQSCDFNQSGSIGMVCLFNSVSKSRLMQLFDKHPTIDARIRALREMW
jgi:heat shock protein HtpX